MSWRQFLKENKVMLLTLPGAMLWSLPIGYWVSLKVQRVLPMVAALDEYFEFAVIFGLILIPISAVCSTIAFNPCIENREGYNRGAAFLLALFNLLTASVAGCGVIWLVLVLLFRLAYGIFG